MPPNDAHDSDNLETETPGNSVVAIVTARVCVKTAKTWLESMGLSGNSISRLKSPSTPTTADINTTENAQYILHTNITTDAPAGEVIPSAPLELSILDLTEPYHLISASPLDAPQSKSPLLSFLNSYLTSHPPEYPITTSQLLSTAPKRSSTYPPLLILPHDAFTAPSWRYYLTKHPSFLTALASSLNRTHIARNAPIAASSIIRAPSGLEYLYPRDHTCPDDFSTALWVHTTQNKIRQTWAPSYTMFSRGNIKEKHRVLNFPDVRGMEVADLYAGIGYFVFSYVKAGATRVWCWEVNPWSVEALRRGCGENGWSVKVVNEHEEFVDNGERVVMFAERNEQAGRRMKGRKVRHVNLGLLPSSSDSWKTAVGLVNDGGWVHVHENCGETEVDDKAKEIVKEFTTVEQESGWTGTIQCHHVERVKTFAPGVVHCVFDIRIGGRPPGARSRME